MSEPVTAIMRLTHPATGSTIDVYQPLTVATLGRITDALGDDWWATMLPADAPRPDRLVPAARGAAAALTGDCEVDCVERCRGVCGADHLVGPGRGAKGDA